MHINMLTCYPVTICVFLHFSWNSLGMLPCIFSWRICWQSVSLVGGCSTFNMFSFQPNRCTPVPSRRKVMGFRDTGIWQYGHTNVVTFFYDNNNPKLATIYPQCLQFAYKYRNIRVVLFQFILCLANSHEGILCHECFLVQIRRSLWVSIFAYHKDAEYLFWLSAILLCCLEHHNDL